MALHRGRALAATAVGTALLLAVSACSGSTSDTSSGGSSATKTVVVDNSFDLKTSDPARQFERTGSIVDKALYQTLLTFDGSDVTKPVPQLASYEESDDNKVLTLTIKSGQKFSDGSPVTADDVVFSLERVQGIKGNPSFMLDGVKIAKTGDDTVTLTSKTPNPALPFILPNPSLGIVNSKVVKAHGGTTDSSDKAEAFLNKTSAGSGPYELESYDASTKVVFKPNPNYAGTKPTYGRVVLRNVQGPTQKLNVQAGDSQVALDLNPDQAKGLGSSVKVTNQASAYAIFLLLNQDSKIGGPTADPKFAQAVRQGVDYSKLLGIAGEGSVQPGGIIPTVFLGGIPASEGGNGYDLAAAKAALAASGYKGEQITLHVPNDITVSGLSLSSIAEAVQSQLEQVGIKVKLAPAPVASELDAYRTGKEQMGLWYWGPDYPDPSDYLVFAPGGSVGLRANWKKDATVGPLAEKAATATGEDDRKAAYAAFQKAMNEAGTFVPLLQPAQNVAAATSITSLPLNAVWTLDFAAIK